MNGMRTPCLLLMLVLSTSALAGETLPESAPTERDDQTSMKDRFRTPPLAAEEMEQMYLESPVELGNAQEEGMRSVQDRDKYSETDLLFREQRQGSLSTGQSPRAIEPPPPQQPVPFRPQQL